VELRGRRALVTGGGVRLGRVLAHSLLRRGVHVAIHYHRSEHGARQTAVEGEAMGAQVALLQANLADPQQALGLGPKARQALGGLDILVNSAAILERRPFAEVTPADWARTMDLNLRGAFFAAQGAVAAMGEAGGAIVNIADLAAFERWTAYPVHVISKAGIVVMTELLAKSLAPKVRVNAVAPGAVLLPDDWGPEPKAHLERTTPLGRLTAPADVADAVLFLLEHDSMTGETIVVDGGRRVR